jgi:cell division septation protein DedD
MAENKLEGFEDFDNMAAGGQGGSQPAGGAAGELDDLLGKEGGAAEGGESELDSFFEDLSTIDDLEVMQEEEKPAAAAPAPAAPAAPPPREEKAAAPAPKPKPVKVKTPRAPGKPGRLRRIIMLLVLIGIFGGGGYYVYTTYIAGEGKIPWPTFDTSSLFPKKTPPKPVEPVKPTKTEKPVAVKPTAPRHTGPTFGIQVATCFFDSCVSAYKEVLQAHDYKDVKLLERSGKTEVLEIYSQTGFTDRQAAQDLSDKINRENRLEGNAFVLEEAKAFRLSMGSFTDLSRANAVKDSLNQRYHGEVVFGQRIKALPYSLKAIVTGKYYSRADAEKALTELRRLDRAMDGAFIVQN